MTELEGGDKMAEGDKVLRVTCVSPFVRERHFWHT